jgi:hypothetical protein
MSFPQHFVYDEPGGQAPWVPVEGVLDFLNYEFSKSNVMTVPNEV